MFTWYDIGYFADELEISYGENSMFFPLKSYKEISMNKLMSNGNSTPNHIYNAEHSYP
jgi:hypothetical protein